MVEAATDEPAAINFAGVTRTEKTEERYNFLAFWNLFSMIGSGGSEMSQLLQFCDICDNLTMFYR